MATNLKALNVDVQLMILDVLSQEAPRSLLNVALSSRNLYHLSRSFIYRDVHFTFNRSRRDINGRLIRQLLADHDLCNKVQQIRILWAPSAKLQPGEGSKEEFELLRQALPKLAGLRTFVWDAQYPILSWLLEALQRHHPNCRLYYRHPASQDSARTLPRLRDSPCLFSLDVTLPVEQVQAQHELQKVLVTAPSLTDLTIASTSHSPHVVPLVKEEEYQRLNLRSLEFYGPDFHSFMFYVVWTTLERLSLDTLSLDTLSLDTLSLNLMFMPSFPNLRSFKLRIQDSATSMFLGAVLRSCKKLETLDLTCCHSTPQLADKGLWESVGKSLIKLRLHGEEARRRAVIPSNTMGFVAMYCSSLRSLGLDLGCSEQEWPYPTLKGIAEHFWFLVHLELDILIKDPQHDHPTSPKATLDSVPEIWKYLWQQTLNFRVREGHSITKPRLKSLDLIVGSFRPDSDPGLQSLPVDQQRFTFDLSDRDDEASLGIANVKCVELEALLSKLPSPSTWNHQQELIVKVAKERARKGPHIRMPSVMDTEMVRPSPFWDLLDKERFPYR